MSSLDNVNTCGSTEIVIFVLSVIFGTANSVLAKAFMSVSVSVTDEENESHHAESFHKPLFLTFIMFLGTLLVLPMHWAVTVFKLNFPGYEFDHEEEIHGDRRGFDDHEEAQKHNLDSTQTSMHLHFILPILAVIDLVATAAFMIGLQYLHVSIQQVLRGSQIIFIALLKHNVLKQRLLKFHWVGVFWNMISVVLVGMAALLSSADKGEDERKDVPMPMVVLGVCLILLGSFTRALEMVIMEHVMKTDDSAPPLLVTGMIGTSINLHFKMHDMTQIMY